MDAGAAHALAADLHQEGGRRVRHEPARQLERALEEVVGRAWKAGAQGLPDHRHADGIRAAEDQLVNRVGAHATVPGKPPRT